MLTFIRNCFLAFLLFSPLCLVDDETLDMQLKAHRDQVRPTCVTYTIPETDEGWRTSRLLLKWGWTGRPGDGAERLYSPFCPR